MGKPQTGNGLAKRRDALVDPGNNDITRAHPGARTLMLGLRNHR